LKVNVYMLTCRCGCDMGCPLCSADYKQVYDTMKQEFDDTISGLANGYEKEESSCSEFEAVIVTSGDQYEWFITKQEIEVTLN
jgi:hypothetical protein